MHAEVRGLLTENTDISFRFLVEIPQPPCEADTIPISRIKKLRFTERHDHASKVIRSASGEAGDGNHLCPVSNHGFVLIPVRVCHVAQTYEPRGARWAGRCARCWRGEERAAAGRRSPVGWAVGTWSLTQVGPAFQKLVLCPLAFTKDLCQYLALLTERNLRRISTFITKDEKQNFRFAAADTGAACTPESRAAPPSSLGEGDHTQHPSIQCPAPQHPAPEL